MVKSWIEAMRLRTLPASVAGVIMAWAYAVAGGTFKPLPALLCLIFAVLCQIASNFANEYYDYRAGRDRAGREGPRRGVTEGDITPRAMKLATYGILAAAALIGLSLTYWGGLWLIIPGIAIAIGALAYSTGPWPLSTHCMGEAAVILFFGIVPVNLTYYVQSLAWSADVLTGSIVIGLLAADVLIVNNTRDIPDDRAVGKHTLATALGRRAMTALYIIFGLSVLTMLPQWSSLGGDLLAAVPCLFAGAFLGIGILISRRYGASLTPCLALTSVFMLLYSLSFLTATVCSVD